VPDQRTVTRSLPLITALLAGLPFAAAAAADPPPLPSAVAAEQPGAAPAPVQSPLPATGAGGAGTATVPTPAAPPAASVPAPAVTAAAVTAPAAPAAPPAATAPAPAALSAPAATRRPAKPRPGKAVKPFKRRVVFRITGAGFGHGVGMSQYGAYGAALAGWDAGQILRYYYRGADVTTAPGAQVRVLLTVRRAGAPVALSSTGAWEAVTESPLPGTPLPLATGAAYTATATGAGVTLAGPDGKPIGPFPLGVLLRPAAPADPAQQIGVGARAYRGAIRLLPLPGGMQIIDVVDLEQYLGGVVAQEMPASWGDTAPAALQAQAIAARTYTLASLRPTQPFDLYDDTRSQVYGGVSAEDPRALTAVAGTAGQVVAYGGKLITAFYFSTSGGHTEDGSNVFPSTTPMPYLVGVPDPFDGLSPLHRWKPRTVTAAWLGRALGVGGPVAQFKVLRRGSSPRVLSALVVTATGAREEVTGAQVRKDLKLPDTWFSMKRTLLPPAR
jgi:SpoIID/LytB domain protein